MRVLIDTNILLRRIHRHHQQHRLTRTALSLMVSRGDVPCVTAQNLIEFWAVCTRPGESNGLGLAPAQVKRILSRVEGAMLRLSDETDRVYAEWRDLVATHDVSGKKTHDARLVAAMHAHGITHVLTFNGSDFRRFPGILPLHPQEIEAGTPDAQSGSAD